MTVAPMFSDWCPRRLGSGLALLVALAAGSIAAGADEAPDHKHDADAHDVAAGGSGHKPAAGGAEGGAH